MSSETDESLSQSEPSNDHYDVIVLGTGLVESMVACAAAKAGKKVLHMDNNDYYGADNATFSFNHLKDAHRRADTGDSDPISATDNENIEFRVKISPVVQCENDSTKFSVGNDVFLVDSTAEVDSNKLTDCKRPNSKLFHPSCFGFVMEKINKMDEQSIAPADVSCIHPTFHGYVKDHRLTAGICQTNSYSRQFNIDSFGGSSQLLLCSGEMVECLVASGVDKYVEFNCVEDFSFLSGASVKTSGASPPLQQRSVPCSKSDIFNSKQFKLLTKHSLMKFLQFTADWGRLNVDTVDSTQATTPELLILSNDGESDRHEGLLETVNENENLAKGRSLHRPQNKPSLSKKNDVYNIAGFESKPFVDFMKHCKLPEDLQCTILYALCLYIGDGGAAGAPSGETSISTVEGLRRLYQHVTSLGKYGKTAFLYPVYGGGELTQGYCRMCAVWGGVYMLRTSVLHIEALPAAKEVNEEEGPVLMITDSNGERHSCGAFVANSSYWQHATCTSIDSAATKKSLASKPSHFQINRVCVLDQPILTSEPAVAAPSALLAHINAPVTQNTSSTSKQDLSPQHHLTIIPPHTAPFHHNYAIHVTQLTSQLQVCPDACVLVYLSTFMDTDSEDVESPNDVSRTKVKDLMNLLVSELTSGHQKHVDGVSVTVQELFQHTYMRPIFCYNSPLISDVWNASSQAVHPSAICRDRLKGLYVTGNHICGSSSPLIVGLNSLVAQAKDVFTRIFPGSVFMPPIVQTEEEPDEYDAMAMAVSAVNSTEEGGVVDASVCDVHGSNDVSADSAEASATVDP